MKRKSIIGLMVLMLVAQSMFMFAQSTVDLINDFKKGFQDFSDDVASVLPMNSTIGLNWSDAYIGQLLALPPSLGVGLTVGVTGIPYDSVKKILVDTLGGSESEIPQVIRDYGLPLPAMAVDARLGGFILPFDVGFKIGFLPKTLADQVGDNVKVDFLLVGGDIRYLLMKQRFVVIPEVSVGVGYNYLKGSVEFGGVLPPLLTINLPNTVGSSPAPWPANSTLSLSSPDFYIEWETKVIDLKAQASWSLLILQPSVGIGASYGSSHVGGGAKSTLQLNGATISPTALQALRTLGFDVDNASIAVFSDVTGWSFRLFGGVSVNILVLRIDAGVQYNLIGKNLGASIGARIQL
ncbi:MAG: hypothetical protein N2442_00275 [Spirochaetes bacterium]|nr:hypothetical protein [Spirochaetota bacterium]